MKFYSVVLFGNRKGATISKDYGVATSASWPDARRIIRDNGGWGNIKEFNTYRDALTSNLDFTIEIMGQGLSIQKL